MYEHGGVYVDESDDVADAAWEAIDYNSGNVALDDDYVAEMGLPISQRFPWDHSKGLYFMNGQHQIHCLVRRYHQTYQLSIDVRMLTTRFFSKLFINHFFNSATEFLSISIGPTICTALTLSVKKSFALLTTPHVQ